MVFKCKQYDKFFYRYLSVVRQSVHATSIFKHNINSNEHAYLQLLWQRYVHWNRATLLSVLRNSQNEEAGISERNLYRVETAVLSV